MAKFFQVVDVFFAFFVTSPLVIAHWAYVWEFLDVFGKTTVRNLWTGIVSLTILSVLCERRFWLKKTVVNEEKLANPIFSRVYNYVVAISSIMSWRALWLLMDDHIGVTLSSCVPSMLLGIFVLIPLGCLKTTGTCPPFQSIDDDHVRAEGVVFDFPTRFEAKSPFWARCLDTFISLVIASVGTLGVWRALWIPQDLLIVFDNDSNSLQSNFLSCVLGWLSAGFLIAIQRPSDAKLESLEKRTNWFFRFMVESCFSFAQTISTILLWRGIWNLSLIGADTLFGDIPTIYGRLIMSLVTGQILVMFNLNVNAGAKGCLRDGFGIGNYIEYFVLPVKVVEDPHSKA